MMKKIITSSSKRKIIRRRILIFGTGTFLLFIFVYRNIITARNRIITTKPPPPPTTTTKKEDNDEANNNGKNVTTTTTTTTTNTVNSNTIINNNDQNNNINQTSSDNRSYWRPTKEWIDQCVKDIGAISSANRPFNVKWRRYTLGDCFRFCRNCYQKDCVDHPEKTHKKHSGCYEKTSRNDTYSALYYFRSCYQYSKQQQKLLPNGNYSRHIDGSKNWTILEDIIHSSQNNNKNYSIPNRVNEIVIHLRLGDIIENSVSNVSTMLLVGADPRHHEINSIKPISEYLNNIEEILINTNTTNTTTTTTINDNNDKKKKKKKKRWIVTIRGGSHDPKYYKKSRIFATCLQKAIQQYLVSYYSYYTTHNNLSSSDSPGGNVDVDVVDYDYVKMNIEGNTPDEDFYYMGHAKYLIISSGGYSNMIATFAKNNGGIIIGRTFSSKHE